MENVRELFHVMIRRIGLLNKNCCSAEGIEVSVVQSHILYEIERQHNPSMQQVAETLGIDITTFSRQVQSLVESELVKKTPHPEDRRVNILSLTDKGKRVSDHIDSVMMSYYEEIFTQMSPFEKQMVLQSIELLNQAMAKSNRCCTLLG